MARVNVLEADRASKIPYWRTMCFLFGFAAAFVTLLAGHSLLWVPLLP